MKVQLTNNYSKFVFINFSLVYCTITPFDAHVRQFIVTYEYMIQFYSCNKYVNKYSNKKFFIAITCKNKLRVEVANVYKIGYIFY